LVWFVLQGKCVAISSKMLDGLDLWTFIQSFPT